MEFSADQNDEPENVELYIMNDKNVPITEEFICSFVSSYGVKMKKVQNLMRFQKAMTHSTYLVRDPDYKPDKKKKQHTAVYTDLTPVSDPDSVVPLQTEPYERLEFLGDSVLHLAIADYLYDRYPTEDEGFMSRLRTKIENKKSLAWLCQEVGLNKYILISQRMEMFDARRTNDNIMEDSFEAFLGALYREIGFIKSSRFIVNIIEKHFDIVNILRVETNYKDTLLQYHHKMRWKDPMYGECGSEGPDHRRQFTMYVTDGTGRRLAKGTGLSKKEGEQQAARRALHHYGLLQEDATDDSHHSDSESDSDSEEIDLAAAYDQIKSRPAK